MRKTNFWNRLKRAITDVALDPEGVSPYATQAAQALDDGDQKTYQENTEENRKLYRNVGLGGAGTTAVVLGAANPAIVGDLATSMLGGAMVDKASEHFTGKPFGQWVASGVGAENAYNNNGVIRFTFDSTNPGYWVTAPIAKAISSTAAPVVNLGVDYVKALPTNVKSLAKTYTKSGKQELQQIANDTYDAMANRAANIAEQQGYTPIYMNPLLEQLGLPKNSIISSTNGTTKTVLRTDVVNPDAAKVAKYKPVNPEVKYIFSLQKDAPQVAQFRGSDGIYVNRAHFLFPYHDSEGQLRMLNVRGAGGDVNTLVGHESGHFGMKQIGYESGSSPFKLSSYQTKTYNPANRMFSDAESTYTQLIDKAGTHNGLPEEYLADYFGELATRKLPQNTNWSSLSPEVKQDIIKSISSRRNLNPGETEQLLNDFAKYGYTDVPVKPEIMPYNIGGDKWHYYDTDNPEVRAKLLEYFEQRFPDEKVIYRETESPLIQSTPDGEELYYVGQIKGNPKEFKWNIDLMKERLDKFQQDIPFFVQKWRDREYGTAETIINDAGSDNYVLFIPKSKELYNWSGFNNGSNIAVSVNPYQSVNQLRSNKLHEGIMHGTDDIVLPIGNKNGKTVQKLYKEVSNPTDLFDKETVSKLIKSEDALFPWEARATNGEVLDLLHGFNATNDDIRAVVNMMYDDEILSLLEKINAYGKSYANIARHFKGTPEGNQYMQRIRDMLKYLPAASGVIASPSIVKSLTQTEPKQNIE